MITSVRVKNYQSLADNIYLDLTVTRKASEKNGGYEFTNDGTRTSLIQAFIGGNASGKTTILKALALIRWLNTDSFRWNPERNIPVKGFAGSAKTKKSPVCISVSFDLNGKKSTYSVELNNTRILYEDLTIRSMSTSRQTDKKVFSRAWSEDKKKYVISDSYFDFKEKYFISDELRATSVISAASKFGNERATELTDFWNKVKTNIDIVNSYMPYQYQAYHALESYKDNDKMRKLAEQDIRKYDLGIESFGDDGMILHRHGKSSFKLDLDEESSGTQQFLALKERVDFVLENGGVALIDELNAYLHPLMVESIIDKFKDPEVNKGRGQFLFSTHDLGVFKSLDPYQITLAEKNQNGKTSLKRFDSENIRPTDDYIKRYLAGQYGGLQRFKPE
jgi:AAA15 family ATPase/GTPase